LHFRSPLVVAFIHFFIIFIRPRGCDAVRQVFREDFLLDLDLEVRPWCGDIEHDKPRYFLFHVSWDAADPDPMPHALHPSLGLFGLKMHTIASEFGTFLL
jgi:hypothetical protein